MEFRSRCYFCVRHEKRTDKLSVRQQSIYFVKNARNALLGKHCFSQYWPLLAKFISLSSLLKNFLNPIYEVLTPERRILVSEVDKIYPLLHNNAF